jgi:hypothetical protein
VVDGEDGWVMTCLVEAIGEGGCCGLTQHADDVEARDDAGVFGGLALLVVEVGGDGYHGVLDPVGSEYVDVLGQRTLWGVTFGPDSLRRLPSSCLVPWR